MISSTITLILMLSLPVAFSRERWANFRYRRMPSSGAQSAFVASGTDAEHSARRNSPFIIRVPYSKIAPSNALFSHSVTWKAKQAPPIAAAKSADESNASANPEASSATSSAQSQTLGDVQVSQFHSQDTNGQVVFGFNAPDQMRIEQRNADGTVHGTYSYLDPYGQIIKRQYWDTGAGFHVASDTYPFGDNLLQNTGSGAAAGAQYTPEVQAARDLHFQLYQQALASFLPSSNSLRNDLRRNGSVPSENVNSSSNGQHSSNSSDSGFTADAVIVTPSATVSEDVDSTFSPSSSTTSQSPITHSDNGESVIAVDANQGSFNIVEPDTENGSIVIQKPDYLRISWTTENKRNRGNFAPAAAISNHNDDKWSEKSTATISSPDIFNVSKFMMQSGRLR